MFNIKTYLNSLPEDTEEINVSHKGIYYLPNLSRFKNLKILHCQHNQLTYLPPLENLQKLYCSHNKLTSLYLNKKLEILFCESNQLTDLHLNKNLQTLICSNNQLTSLHLNENLKDLYCSHNQLSSLHLNKNLEQLYCYYNRLTSLQLNEKIILLCCTNNPIYEIINSYYTPVIKQKLRVLNQFRYLYYCLKFKKRFRDWLWVKIREPKIREKYSHDYLVKNLNEDTDLDELLENW